MGFVRKNFGVDLTGNQAVRTAAAQQMAGIDQAQTAITGAFDQTRPMLEAQAAPFQGLSQQFVDFLNPQAQADFAMNNPLLRFMADEAQRRVFASGAARGKLGSTATAATLQNALVEQGMEAVRQRQQALFGAASLGMTPQTNLVNAITGNAQDIANLRTGRAQVGAASTMAQQANISNLFGAAGGALGGLLGSAAGPAGAAAGQQAGQQQFGAIGGGAQLPALPAPF